MLFFLEIWLDEIFDFGGILGNLASLSLPESSNKLAFAFENFGGAGGGGTFLPKANFGSPAGGGGPYFFWNIFYKNEVYLNF
jgi:hypothetical protein